VVTARKLLFIARRSSRQRKSDEVEKVASLSCLINRSWGAGTLD
jgi:hypothetical protein